MRMKYKHKFALYMAALIWIVGLLGLPVIRSEAATTGTVSVYALNIRASGTTDSTILGVLNSGEKVSVLGTSGNWYKISAVVAGKSVTGYVLMDYVTTDTNEGKTQATAPAVQTSTATQASGTVNVAALTLHTEAAYRSNNVAILSKGAKVTILRSNGVWYYVQTTANGKTVYGYAFIPHILTGGTVNVTEESSNYETPIGIVNVAVLNVRKEPSTTAGLLGTIALGARVQLLKTSGDWYYIYVTINGTGTKGYVHKDYVTTGTSFGQSTNEGDMNMTTLPAKQPVKDDVTRGRVDCYMLNVRKGPGTSYEIAGYLYEDDLVIIKSENAGWYQITATSNGKTVSGYVLAEYVRLVSGSTEASDASFEAQIANFPESYKSGLRMLHKNHPNWTFKLYQTGIDWNEAVAQESKFAVATIESDIAADTNFARLSTESGAYNWATDTYTVCDGSRWYSASKDLIQYYMDPRNFLEEKYIYCFENLSYNTSQKLNVVQNILKNTFMSGNYTETDPSTGKTYSKNYAETFMEAGKLSGASPYFLAARSFGENGAQGSGQTSGNYGSYKGYYNFYSIGASDGADAQANGLRYAMKTNAAYLLPWNTRYKAIVGGAKFIAAEYINVGQDTLYFQKFNVSNKESLYWHQYMTSVNGACYGAGAVYQTYKSYGIDQQALEFTIPVYNNMPATACAMPYGGNPNPYIKTITINNGSYRLTPTFSYNVYNYSLVVPNSISQVTVGAQAVSRFAKGITGTGTYSLAPGETKTITLTCTAGNGTNKAYTVKIYRER